MMSRIPLTVCDELHLLGKVRDRCRQDAETRRLLAEGGVRAGTLPAGALTMPPWWRLPWHFTVALWLACKEWRRTGRLLVDVGTFERRAAACQSCPFYVQTTDRCGHRDCGCAAGAALGALPLAWWRRWLRRVWLGMVKGKLWWAASQCPDRRW